MIAISLGGKKEGKISARVSRKLVLLFKKIPVCILQVEINSSIQPIKEIDAQVSFVVSVDMLHFPTRFHETPVVGFLCNPADRLKTCLHPGFCALEELPVTWAEQFSHVMVTALMCFIRAGIYFLKSLLLYGPII